MENAVEQTLQLKNRSELSLTGVEKIISVSESVLTCKLTDSDLTVLGENLHITKLDVEKGYVELTGTINTIKFGSVKNKENFIKRIFK